MNTPLKWEKGGLKSPLSRAKGLGSAHSGMHHWLRQRFSALAAIPLTVWLLWSIPRIVQMDHAAFTAWLSHPCNAVLMILTVVTFFYHAWQGNQVVIEDYLHNEGFKAFKLAGNALFLFGAAIACLFAVLKVAL